MGERCANTISGIRSRNLGAIPLDRVGNAGTVLKGKKRGNGIACQAFYLFVFPHHHYRDHASRKVAVSSMCPPPTMTLRFGRPARPYIRVCSGKFAPASLILSIARPGPGAMEMTG